MNSEARNETNKLSEEKLDDLTVADEEAEVTKAGEGRTRLVVGDDQGVFVR